MPLTGARISCCTGSPDVSGEAMLLEGAGYRRAVGVGAGSGRRGMNSAATHTSTVTIASVVTAPGN